MQYMYEIWVKLAKVFGDFITMMHLVNSSSSFVMKFGSLHSFSSSMFVLSSSVYSFTFVCRIVIYITVCNFMHQA